MSIFKTAYTLKIEKGVDKSRELFENSFLDMAKKGYSSSTVIHHPSYGLKNFSGTIDNGTYKARLILSHETDDFYRSAPVNEITFAGNEAETTVKVVVKKIKYGFVFLCILAVSIILLGFSLIFIEDLTMLISFVVAAFIVLLLSFVPLLIARYRVTKAKEELIYILKYADN